MSTVEELEMQLEAAAETIDYAASALASVHALLDFYQIEKPAIEGQIEFLCKRIMLLAEKGEQKSSVSSEESNVEFDPLVLFTLQEIDTAIAMAQTGTMTKQQILEKLKERKNMWKKLPQTFTGQVDS